MADRVKPSLGARIKNWFGFDGAQEGSWRGPYMGMGELNNWYPMSSMEDGWQRHLRVDHTLMQYIPAVSGAVHLHGSAGAQLRPSVLKFDEDRNVINNRGHVASRTLVMPNPFETGSEFQSRCFRYVVLHGMACILGLRNNRFEVSQMYVLEPGTWSLYIDPDSREPFIMVNQDGLLAKLEDATMLVPMRDVFIFKWASSRNNSLLGESPLEAAGMAGAIYTALSRSQAAFFHNMRRPSGALITEEKLTQDQMRQLRSAFDEQAKSMQSGGVPILAGGLKWNPMSITSQDAEAIETLKMTTEEIARAVGVPPPLLGQLDNATLSNVEQLVSHWMSISLGGLIERFERGLDRLFGLNSVTDRIEMDTTALLRTDFAERMQSYGRAIQGGVMTPNEVRRKEGLSPIEGGDDVFLQRQMTSVSLLARLNESELQNSNSPQNQDPPENQNEDDPPEDTEDEKFHRLEEMLSALKADLDELADPASRDEMRELHNHLGEITNKLASLESSEEGVTNDIAEHYHGVIQAIEQLQNGLVSAEEKSVPVERISQLEDLLGEIKKKVNEPIDNTDTEDRMTRLETMLATIASKLETQESEPVDFDNETAALIVRDAISKAKGSANAN